MEEVPEIGGCERRVAIMKPVERQAAKSLPPKSTQHRQYRDPKHVPQPNHGERGKASRQ
jgi:hypothetical protein